jgi:hypothetical protein
MGFMVMSLNEIKQFDTNKQNNHARATFSPRSKDQATTINFRRCFSTDLQPCAAVFLFLQAVTHSLLLVCDHQTTDVYSASVSRRPGVIDARNFDEDAKN